MRILTENSPHGFTTTAANWVATHLNSKPQSTLALPTGQTPLGLYAQLVARSKMRQLSLASAYIFNLDEYCGLPKSDPHSYAAFLHQHLIDPLNLHTQNVRLLQGDAPDLQAECQSYDAAIAKHDGIDLCVLGLGTNGHIGFNEPQSAWDLRTHLVNLSEETRAVHARQSPVPRVIPSHGLTMGIQTILEARHVLLLVAGANKRGARDALRGHSDPRWPVTSLLSHPNLTIVELS